MKRAIIVLHRWIGLTAGLLCVVLAVTGAVLAMRPQAEPVIYPQYRAPASCLAPAASLDAMLASARRAHAGEASYIRFSPGSDESARVRFRDAETVFVDPCSGSVLGTQNRYGGLFGTFEQLHTLAFEEGLSAKLFGTSLHKLVSGSAAIVLIFLALGGLYLWWPRRWSAWRAGIRFNPRLTGRAFARNLHTTVGLYTGLIVLVSALTGLPIAFEWPKAVLRTVAGSGPTEAVVKSHPPAPGAPRASLDSIWHRIQAENPRVGSALIAVARRPEDPVTAYTVDRDAPHPEARTYIWFDAYTGDKLQARPWAQIGAGMRLYYWGLALHTGHVGGLPVQLLLLAGALGVPVLAYTGVASWMRKNRRAHALAPAPIPVKVAAVRHEAPGISTFELMPIQGATLPPFSPGAHIDVMIADGVTRQYSLCNGPNETDRYIIAVKREAQSRGGSQTLHERVRERDLLLISPPRNNFPLAPAAKRHVLVAAGIGITPILCMARHLQAAGSEWTMHYVSRSPEETPFLEELKQRVFAGRVVFHMGLDRQHRNEMLHHVLRPYTRGDHLYVCGPRGFMTTVLEIAGQTWPKDALHVEHFGADPRAASGPQSAFEVELAHSGRIVTVPACLSVAQALAIQGVPVSVSCEQGVCGNCVTEVLAGIPDHRDSFLSDAERKSGRKMALCVSRAKSERLVLAL